MKTAMIALIVALVAGVTQLVLGILTWSGDADFLIPVHISIGLVLVIAMLVLSYLAFRSKITTGLVILAVVWAVLLPVLGLTQENLLPDTNHVIIQVLHLLTGIVAVILALVLGLQLRKKGA